MGLLDGLGCCHPPIAQPHQRVELVGQLPQLIKGDGHGDRVSRGIRDDGAQVGLDGNGVACLGEFPDRAFFEVGSGGHGMLLTCLR